MIMAISAAQQTRVIAKAIAHDFAAAPLTSEERNPQRIVHTQLPWTVPPLRTNLALNGQDIQHMLDAPVPTDAKHLLRFWKLTLKQMWTTPSQVMRNGTMANLTSALPKVKMGQRALRFSEPAQEAGLIDPIAAIQLSLEVAHTAYISLPVVDMVEDENTYVVTLADGTEFGVRDGLPVVDSPWKTHAKGLILDLLETPRGQASYVCHFDQIASVRSVIHEYPEKFPHNFDALDLGLQALRYLTLNGHCPELTTAMVMKPMEVAVWREKENAYMEALEVINSQLNDRAKLYTLQALLVPLVMSMSKFRREIFSASNYPFTMPAGRAEIIATNLRKLYMAEVPTAMQRQLEDIL
jgi:hypothetical protein